MTQLLNDVVVQNRNALFAAVETGEAEVVEWLSNRGADMSVRDAQVIDAPCRVQD